MISRQIYIVLIVIVLVAFLVDVYFLRWLKAYLNRRNKGYFEDNDQKTYFLGVYSPVLTWVNVTLLQRKINEKSLPPFLRRGTHMKQESEPPPAQGNANQLSDLPPFLQQRTRKIPSQTSIKNWLLAKASLLELLLILSAVLLYCAGILDLGSDHILPGNEGENFQTIDLILVKSLSQFHQFPLWNPYIYTGLPYVADPMLHIYNPVVTLPVLLFGVRDGFKIAIFLSYLLGALGMWWLGRIFDLSRPVRLWIALMYTFAGQPTARFFQGEYLFILGFAFIPWIIGNLFLLAEKPSSLRIVTTALSLALLFFCGNAYYQFFTLFVILIFSLVMLFHQTQKKNRVVIDWKLARSLGLVGILALAMIAVQLFPLVEFWPHISKGNDIQGSQTPYQVWLDYTSKDTYRPDAYRALPAREEYYAYIGVLPILGLLLLPLAIRKRPKRPLLFLGLLLLLVIAWVDLYQMPWRDVYINTSLFNQFRHVLRPLVFGSFAILLLAGTGVDSLWRLLRAPFSQPVWQKIQPTLAPIGLAIAGFFMFYTVWDTVNTNGKYVHTEANFPLAYEATRWLRAHVASEFYVRHNPNNSWLYPTLDSSLRFIDAWYPLNDIRRTDDQINTRLVQARPNYIMQSGNDPTPADRDIQLFNEIDGYQIYRLPHSLPIAFTVDTPALYDKAAGELQREDVSPLTPYFDGNNHVEVIAQGSASQTMVVEITHYPGWKVLVDGKPTSLVDVGGYLATPLAPGIHKYDFIYHPTSFFVGLWISLLAFLAALYVVVREFHPDWAKLRIRSNTGWQRIQLVWQRTQQKLIAQRMLTDAIYRQGVLTTTSALPLVEETRVHLVVEPTAAGISPTRLVLRRWGWATGDVFRLAISALSLASVLCTLGVGVYLATRTIHLTSFPIYFFTDEAIQTLDAADLVRDHLRDPDQTFLPTYFKNGNYYNLSVSVYLQVIPYLLFGKSIFTTRFISVLVSLLAAIFTALALRHIYKISYWWSGPLILAIIPAWFLHSRTAFETVIFASLYATLLYAYLLYRYRSPRYVYLTLILAALCFYTYSPGQLIIAVTGVLLFLSDIPYHWQNRKLLFKILGLLCVLALPYLRFHWEHGNVGLEQLKLLASYWVQPLPIGEKIIRFTREYFYGLSPGYWYIPNQHDLARHLMKGYGHIPWITFPFALLGLGICLWNIRSAMHRLLLIAMLAAPAGGALVGIGITRVLVFVIPITWMITIGLDFSLTWLSKLLGSYTRSRYPRLSQGIASLRPTTLLLPLALFAFLTTCSFSMINDALVNGPTWYHDYGLGGMQYGAPAVFDAAQDYLDSHTGTQVIISPNWGNGTDVLERFFISNDLPVTMGSIEGFLHQKQKLSDDMLFVMIPQEYNDVLASQEFKDIRIERIVAYPDGKPGFYFVRLRYADNIDQILAAEQQQYRALITTQLEWIGQTVLVQYSPLDMGKIQNIFDNDPNSLARTRQANPAIYKIKFTHPVTIQGVSLRFGSTEADVKIQLYTAPNTSPITYHTLLYGTIDNPYGAIRFQTPVTIEQLDLQLTDSRQGEPGNVHLWDIALIQ